MSVSTHSPTRSATARGRLLAPFAEALVAQDLPALPPDRRRSAVEFTVARVGVMPGPMRVGVLAIAAAVRAVILLAGAGRTARVLADTSVPLIGEYVRLHRSLVYAYVWETWPTTRRDGSPA